MALIARSKLSARPESTGSGTRAIRNSRRYGLIFELAATIDEIVAGWSTLAAFWTILYSRSTADVFGSLGTILIASCGASSLGVKVKKSWKGCRGPFQRLGVVSVGLGGELGVASFSPDSAWASLFSAVEPPRDKGKTTANKARTATSHGVPFCFMRAPDEG